MRYISTNKSRVSVDLEEAVERCVASDGGLFMPEDILAIPQAFYRNIAEMSFRDIAYVVATSFIGNSLPAGDIKAIVDETFSIEAPLRRLADGTYILELFHGPTMTFKDYGARFMARLMSRLDAKSKKKSRRNVLVATMGNSGAAAASGMSNVDGIDVFVLFPRGVITGFQLSQLASLGKNIHPLEVLGTIDDCKDLVKKAIADPSLFSLSLTGANSINIARLIPQIVFTLHSYASLIKAGEKDAAKAAYSIPCGNLSNLVAAAIAKRLGCPVGPIVAASNINDPLRAFVEGQSENPQRCPIRTYSPGMDTVQPSCLPRLKHLYGCSPEALARDIIVGSPITDFEIAETICRLRKDSAYTIDPHGAAAVAALSNELAGENIPKVVFATGHPARQNDIMKRIIGVDIELPDALKNTLAARKRHEIMPATLPALRKHLNENSRKQS